MKELNPFFVYIVRCKNGNFYTGFTNNLEKRIAAHNRGKGAKYLRGKVPVKLIYAKECGDLRAALRAERQIKLLTREEKKKLIKRKK